MSIPSVVLMNPPFSALAKVPEEFRMPAFGTLLGARPPRPRRQASRDHRRQCRPDLPDWRDTFVALQGRARVVFSTAIAGTVYARHGTGFRRG